MKRKQPLPPNRKLPDFRPPPQGIVDAPDEEATSFPGESSESSPKNSRRASAAPRRGKPRSAAASQGDDAGASWSHGLRSALGIVLVAATSLAVAWAVRHHVMTSPRFAIRAIHIEGASKRNPDELQSFAGLEKGKNIFSVDLEATRLRLLQDPWVDKAVVNRKLPSTIVVELTEREAAAVVVVGTDLYLCTPEGEIFKHMDPADPRDLVVITGINAEQVAKDRSSVVRRLRTALDLVSYYERRGPAKRLPPQELHLLDDGTLRMTVGKEAVILEFGKEPYRPKVARAARVLEEVARRNADPTVVLLDNDAHPDRVVVRMR